MRWTCGPGCEKPQTLFENFSGRNTIHHKSRVRLKTISAQASTTTTSTTSVSFHVVVALIGLAICQWTQKFNGKQWKHSRKVENQWNRETKAKSLLIILCSCRHVVQMYTLQLSALLAFAAKDIDVAPNSDLHYFSVHFCCDKRQADGYAWNEMGSRGRDQTMALMKTTSNKTGWDLYNVPSGCA